MVDGRAFEFEEVIREGSGGGAYVRVPVDVEEAFGARRVKVRATFDGEAYRGSIAFMGGEPLLIVTKAVRAAVGKGVGDRVRVVLRRDTEPRSVEVPPELREALDARPDLRDLFDGLAYTHRKEYARWVGEAKRQETRDRRTTKALEMIEKGQVRS